MTRTDSSGARNFLVDGLGSTVALTDSAGVTQTQYSYDQFGNTTAGGPANGNPFQFTRRENEGNGLYYYRARYYNQNTGRFLSEDPIRFNGGTANFYSYAANSPTNFIDPFGDKIGVRGNYMSYLMAIMYLNTSPAAAAIIQELENAAELYMVEVSDLINADHVDGATYGTIYWNPHQALCVKKGGQSPAIQLLHEMVHVGQHRHHVRRFAIAPDGLVDLWEQPAVQATNPAATQLGEPTRANYMDAGAAPNVLLPITHGRACGCDK